MKAAPADRRVRFGRGNACWRGQFEAMAGPCEVLCDATDAGEAETLARLAAAEAWRIETKFSRYVPGNLVDRINSADGDAVEVDAESAQLIDFAASLHAMSDGRFDITSGVLRRVWSFDGSDRLPEPAAVEACLQDVGWHRVDWSAPLLRLDPGMQLDFGGIGKEYAVDRAAQLLRERSAASCLVNFGGDLAVTRPPRQFDHWNVGIEALTGRPGAAASLLNLRVGALATSGDARRYLLRDGRRYSHILDPRTGWPVPDAPHSTTVAADTCTQAGMLATLAMLEGQGAEAFLDAQGARYWCQR